MTTWKICKVKFTEVKPMPGNPRTISDKALAGLERSIERFGYVEPIVWNRGTGHIIGGHQRYGVLKGKGVKEATMVVVDLSPDEEMAANLTLNNPKIEGTWDEPILTLLEEIEDGDGELFKSLNMSDLKTSLDKTPSKEKVEGGIDIKEDQDGDTACPCCGHKWKIEATDVIVDMGGRG